MDKFLIKTKRAQPTSSETNVGSSKKSRLDDTLNNIPADPGLRTRILDYDPNI